MFPSFRPSLVSLGVVMSGLGPQGVAVGSVLYISMEVVSIVPVHVWFECSYFHCLPDLSPSRALRGAKVKFNACVLMLKIVSNINNTFSNITNSILDITNLNRIF